MEEGEHHQDDEEECEKDDSMQGPESEREREPEPPTISSGEAPRDDCCFAWQLTTKTNILLQGAFKNMLSHVCLNLNTLECLSINVEYWHYE